MVQAVMMLFPSLTAAYTALLGLVYLGLSAWVIAGRAKFRVNLGDGGHDRLNRRIRAHANFAEYVPLVLLLIGLLEGSGASHGLVQALLAVLLVARVMHPIGMVAPEASLQQFLFRGLSVVVTFAVITIAAVWLLVRVA